ncbi:MAG: hypothetical protein ACJ73D_07680 [Pyrinomonadaceae bacterium]
MPERTDVPELSLVQGGPVFQLFCWMRLSDRDLNRPYRRAIFVAALAWIPLLILSIVDGRAHGNGIGIPFLDDISAHVRFLIALPALIIGDKFAQEMIGPRIREFLDRMVVRERDIPRFKAAIDSAHSMRDSILLEAGLMIVVYSVGLWVWSSQIASATSSWYAAPDGTKMNVALAGYWLVFVSLPIFQFLLVRWYLRIAIWLVFLLRVSRLDLRLIATHADRLGGIGFLGEAAFGFAPLLFAQGALISAVTANGILYSGRHLTDLYLEIGAFVILLVASVLGPLCVFSPKMVIAKLQGLMKYGTLASKYVAGFDTKWIGGVNPQDETLLGTGDIQSLADLGTSYAVLHSMRPVPFDLNALVWLLGVTLLPLVPLVFFTFSIEELFDKLWKILI